MEIRTLLCPTDLSPNSRVGLACAVSLARDHEAELVIFHVVPVSLADLSALCRRELSRRIKEDCGTQDILARLRLAAESKVNSHLETFFGDRLAQIRWRTSVGFGNVCREIVDTAATAKANLIVMAKRHRGALQRQLSASVSERVSREAPCPVLSVCPPQILLRDEGPQWTIFPGVLQGF